MSAKRILKEVLDNYSDPYWWRDRYEHRLLAPAQQHLYGNRGVAVMEENWDNLLILDACRADLFEDVFVDVDFDHYRRVKSLGGSTPEWLQRNFSNGEYGDTIYVTGNPQVSKHASDAFYKIVEVWDGGFNEELRTVLAETVVDATLEAAENYPNKRLIAHFMQPHTPYLERDSVFPAGHAITKEKLDDSPEELRTMVEEVGRDTVWEAYEHTLEVIKDDVLQLAGRLNGRTVITADHGELFGERAPPFFTRLYGHKTGVRYPALVEVPWAVIDGHRRKIVDEGVNEEDSNMDTVEAQLKALGYK